MNIDLALVLTVLTLVSGFFVALNRFYLQRGERQGGAKTGAVLSTVIDYSRSFFPVLLIVLVIRSFIFEPFRIPSGSMMPTLLEGDFIFVKKYSYGLKLPVSNTKIVETGLPGRGDVVVFRLPQDTSVNYIKRVVGIPGDRVVYDRHRISINGQIVDLQPADPASENGALYYEEQLDGESHRIQVTRPDNIRGDNLFVVPAGHYFMMGDNRDNSQDSRFIGFVPEENLVGEAVRVWMHIDGLEWPDWSRVGMKIE